MRFLLLLLLAMALTITWQSSAVAYNENEFGWLLDGTVLQNKDSGEDTTDRGKDEKTRSGDEEPECE